MSTNDNSKKNFFKEWLEKLQQESWQLELLISGLALFGIYESRSWIDQFGMYIDQNFIDTARTGLRFLYIVLSAGWKIFFFNLLVHVILRGLWIGAIGLRYVSEEIEYEKLNYGSYFTEYLEKKVGDFDDYIESLEKICSVLFAYTFLLFLMFFSISLFFLEVVLLFSLLSRFFESNPMVPLIPFLFVLVGFIVFIDFITAGLLKKIEERNISRIYAFVYRFYSTLTLSFIYRPLLYNFLDNKYTRRLFFFSIPYILLIFTATKIAKSNPFIYYPEEKESARYGQQLNTLHYEDRRLDLYKELNFKNESKSFTLPYVTLNSMMIEKSFMEVFLKMSVIEEKVIPDSLGIEPYWEKGVAFTLFSDNKNDDPWFKEQLGKMSTELSPLRKERRDLRKAMRKIKDDKQKKDSYKSQIDSLDHLISEIRETYGKVERKFIEDKLIKVKDAIIEGANLKIDDEEIDKEIIDSYFHEHPHNSEKGIMCIIQVDSLSKGKHMLSYKKRTGNNNIRYQTKSIPFYKE